jgi:hypothetical protein
MCKNILNNDRPKHFTETGPGVLSFLARLLDDMLGYFFQVHNLS